MGRDLARVNMGMRGREIAVACIPAFIGRTTIV